MKEDNNANNAGVGNVYPCIYPIPFMPQYVTLANAYVPYQQHAKSFLLCEALKKGTLFPELYQPYKVKIGGGRSND